MNGRRRQNGGLNSGSPMKAAAIRLRKILSDDTPADGQQTWGITRLGGASTTRGEGAVSRSSAIYLGDEPRASAEVTSPWVKCYLRPEPTMELVGLNPVRLRLRSRIADHRTASTSIGTVSLVSVFSALKPVAMTRLSIQWAIESKTGIIKNRPGPLRAWNLPRRKITARSH